MAVDLTCAISAFSTMEKEVLLAIREIAESAKTGLAALKAQKEALLLSLNIVLVPLQIKRDALQAVINEARARTEVIPSGLVVLCPGLGAINTTFEVALLGRLEGVQNMVFDIDRILSEKAQTSAQIAQMDAGTQFLNDVIESIDLVLSDF